MVEKEVVVPPVLDLQCPSCTMPVHVPAPKEVVEVEKAIKSAVNKKKEGKPEKKKEPK